jgi:hypothetical protein
MVVTIGAESQQVFSLDFMHSIQSVIFSPFKDVQTALCRVQLFSKTTFTFVTSFPLPLDAGCVTAASYVLAGRGFTFHQISNKYVRAGGQKFKLPKR